MSLLAQLGSMGQSNPYPITRLIYTLLFMFFVLGAAVLGVRLTSRNRLFSQVVTTLGIFLVVIGTIVYTVAFRGLHFFEMVFSWSLSAVVIYWFLGRMHRIARAETEMRLAAIKESETRFQAIIENAAEIVSIVEEGGARRYVSPAVTPVLGYQPNELVGRSFFELVHPDDVLAARVLMNEVADQPGSARSDEVRYRHADGSWRTLNVTAKNLHDVRGVEGIVINQRDITHQKALETELRQAQRMETVGQLAGGVAHDFNNLLTAINGRTDFLAEAKNLDSNQREDVEEIRRAAHRAASLTRQLLAFSRKQVLTPRVVDLNSVVRGMEPMLRRLIGEDISVQIIPDDSIGHIMADSGQLEQVLLNLSLNSRDAMPDGGVLRIETSSVRPDNPDIVGTRLDPSNLVALSVSDTGEGMDEHTREHIFEPFFTTKPEGKGTGLGLSTVYGIVKQSGATITVDSEPGRGTTFRIYFPRTEAELAPGEVVPTRRSGSERLLIVEDDRAVRQLVERILKERGYRVIAAADGREALHAFVAAPDQIDMVLTDLIMPGMSGRELIQAISQIRPDLKALYMSGYTEDEIIRRGLHDPRADLLHKPFTADMLADKVRSTLDARPSSA
ncbi:MAG TPA: PAS domain S-box protein [Gemmatimonadaceae bacterium]|nr:PAS domain S-box protein [Gemmatimonadaceae bacterium]